VLLLFHRDREGFRQGIATYLQWRDSHNYLYHLSAHYLRDGSDWQFTVPRELTGSLQEIKRLVNQFFCEVRTHHGYDEQLATWIEVRTQYFIDNPVVLSADHPKVLPHWMCLLVLDDVVIASAVVLAPESECLPHVAHLAWYKDLTDWVEERRRRKIFS
jgi:hypothetical protein